MARDCPRKTFSAPQRYWDVLEELVAEGRAKNISGALRYVIDEYERSLQQQELAEAAGRLDEDDWMTISGLEADEDDAAGATPWSELVTDSAS